MKIVLAVLVLTLLAVHQLPQYVSLWPADALLFGFLPAGLAYHAGVSLAAALVWVFAVCCAWPRDEESAGAEGRA